MHLQKERKEIESSKKQVGKRNYQKEMDLLLCELQKKEQVPKLLLHSCCAPCSSYVIEYLSSYFEITVYYYNPNIDEQEEYEKRAEEQKKLISQMCTKYPVLFEEGPYDVEMYTNKTKPLALEKEGGARCFVCYALRLEASARAAKQKRFDYFATTLTISPLKNTQKLNEIGEAMGGKYGITYLASDFKKKEGYKKSTQLSKTYHLYRQDYCGCSYSKQEANDKKSLS